MMHSRAVLLRLLILISFLTQSCSPALTPEQAGVERGPWTTRQVAKGVTWKYHRFDSLFDAKQSVTVLDIDLRKVRTRVEFVDSGFFRTSARAGETGALAAVNGSFFNTQTGGSTVFLQHDGVVITPSRDALRAYRDNAGFAIDASGNVSIIRKPEHGWTLMKNYATVLSSGPLLVFDGKPVAQVQEKFNTNRHPRTAIGLTRNRHVIAAVVDGRSPEAYGMTTTELATVMKALGCDIAMNLDGGGSSTVWIKTEGVVNFPSDNKKFDHGGERAVSNCIVFLPAK